MEHGEKKIPGGVIIGMWEEQTKTVEPTTNVEAKEKVDETPVKNKGGRPRKNI